MTMWGKVGTVRSLATEMHESYVTRLGRTLQLYVILSAAKDLTLRSAVLSY